MDPSYTKQEFITKRNKMTTNNKQYET